MQCYLSVYSVQFMCVQGNLYALDATDMSYVLFKYTHTMSTLSSYCYFAQIVLLFASVKGLFMCVQNNLFD